MSDFVDECPVCGDSGQLIETVPASTDLQVSADMVCIHTVGPERVRVVAHSGDGDDVRVYE